MGGGAVGPKPPSIKVKNTISRGGCAHPEKFLSRRHFKIIYFAKCKYILC